MALGNQVEVKLRHILIGAAVGDEAVARLFELKFLHQ
jgi:hypothetical protein